MAVEPATGFLAAEVIRPHIPKLNELMPQVITAIGEARIAMKTNEAGHLTRLRGVLLRTAGAGGRQGCERPDVTAPYIPVRPDLLL